MKSLSLDDSLRYLVTGIVALIYLSVYNPSFAENIKETFGTLGSLLIIYAFGCIFYLIYRIFFYNMVIIRLQNCLRKSSDNLRTFLIGKYELKTYRAELLRIAIVNKFLVEKVAGYRIMYSACHLLYQICLLSLLLFILMIIRDFDLLCLMIFAVFILSLVTGFLTDRRADTLELMSFYSIDNKQLDSLDIFVKKQLQVFDK